MYTKAILLKKTFTTAFIFTIICTAFIATLPIATVKAAPLSITVSRTSGPVGTVVTVSGTNATAEGEIRIYFAMGPLGFFAGQTTANSTGGFSVNITIPTLPATSYIIRAFDVTTEGVGTSPFQIQSSIALSVEEGTCNDEVIIEGYGFASNQFITVEFDGVDVTQFPQPRTDNFGSFKTQFNVPSKPRSTYNVEAFDVSNDASAKFTVLPKITSNIASGEPATAIFLNGTGFAPMARLSVEFDNFNVTMYPQAQTSATGSFMQLFLIPDLPDGEYAINATDEVGNTATAQFIIPSPIMTITPNITHAPAIVTVSGKGLQPNIPIILHLESVFAIDILDLMVSTEKLMVDEYGTYEYSFIVPIAKPGIYSVTAYSMVGGINFIGEKLASASLTIVEDALLIEIKDKIAHIIIPDLGIIKTSLSDINATIVSIEGEIVTIDTTLGMIQADISEINANITVVNGNVVTIQTTLGTIQGTITSVEGNTATIETDVGEVKANLSASTMPLYGTLALAAIAAIAVIILLVMHLQVLRRPKR